MAGTINLVARFQVGVFVSDLKARGAVGHEQRTLGVQVFVGHRFGLGHHHVHRELGRRLGNGVQFAHVALDIAHHGLVVLAASLHHKADERHHVFHVVILANCRPRHPGLAGIVAEIRCFLLHGLEKLLPFLAFFSKINAQETERSWVAAAVKLPAGTTFALEHRAHLLSRATGGVSRSITAFSSKVDHEFFSSLERLGPPRSRAARAGASSAGNLQRLAVEYGIAEAGDLARVEVAEFHVDAFALDVLWCSAGRRRPPCGPRKSASSVPPSTWPITAFAKEAPLIAKELPGATWPPRREC